ncbi:cupin domain-containing protein [Novosphingobium piscinae]|uniref:Cupin domain-containing protein n=1 Tax=Novosphingobium piscinae TaxID=1507448 RepID=A0A7X1FY11_9SPHN|nr:cupin domain-containing protein [Novosphingobium piscinae]MBC2669113.1 cupin domain-containing protein [Novosphingobium piscinae]
MPRIDLETIPQTNRTGYPAPFDAAVRGRWYRRLGPPGGLTQLTASHVVLEPGAWSSQRHWHAAEDELLVMISGEAVLVEDAGRTLLRPGDICAWPAGAPDGHHLINESDAPCVFVAVGTPAGGAGTYPDIDMIWDEQGRYLHRDGTPYPAERPL